MFKVIVAIFLFCWFFCIIRDLIEEAYQKGKKGIPLEDPLDD